MSTKSSIMNWTISFPARTAERNQQRKGGKSILIYIYICEHKENATNKYPEKQWFRIPSRRTYCLFCVKSESSVTVSIYIDQKQNPFPLFHAWEDISLICWSWNIHSKLWNSCYQAKKWIPKHRKTLLSGTRILSVDVVYRGCWTGWNMKESKNHCVHVFTYGYRWFPSVIPLCFKREWWCSGTVLRLVFL